METRELTVEESDGISGGFGFILVGAAVGGVVLAETLYEVTVGGTDYIEEGQKYLAGKGGQL
jgi:hypothetical protein